MTMHKDNSKVMSYNKNRKVWCKMSSVSECSMRIINCSKSNLPTHDAYVTIAAIQSLSVIRDEHPEVWKKCEKLYGTLLNDLFVD